VIETPPVGRCRERAAPNFEEITFARKDTSTIHRPALLTTKGQIHDIYDPLSGMRLQPTTAFPDEPFGLADHNLTSKTRGTLGLADCSFTPGLFGLEVSAGCIEQVSDSTVYPVPPQDPGPLTFPGDQRVVGPFCKPIENYKQLICNHCVFMCSGQDGGFDLDTPFSKCLILGICRDTDIQFLNECKMFNCGSDRTQPYTDLFLTGFERPCEVDCLVPKSGIVGNSPTSRFAL
jgi:hypothetical protein